MPVAPEAQRHNANADKKAEKAGLQAASYEQSQPEGNQRAAAELILSAHKNTPCKSYAEGVLRMLFSRPNRLSGHRRSLPAPRRFR